MQVFSVKFDWVPDVTFMASKGSIDQAVSQNNCLISYQTTAEEELCRMPNTAQVVKLKMDIL